MISVDPRRIICGGNELAVKVKLKAKHPYSDRLELFLPPPTNQLGKIGCGGERLFEVPSSDELIAFSIRNVLVSMDGGAPNSVLIPDLMHG